MSSGHCVARDLPRAPPVAVSLVVRRRLTCSAALLVAVVVASLSCSSPESPALTSIPIQFLYTSPDPNTLPPATIDDAMCYHHSAPSNLQVATSWGAAGRLESIGDRLYTLSIAAVPTNQDVWIGFVDIALCPTKQIWVTSGLTANGVSLIRTSTVETHPVIAFRVDTAGKIVP
jgi:hypothetical protein